MICWDAPDEATGEDDVIEVTEKDFEVRRQLRGNLTLGQIMLPFRDSC